MIHFYGQQCCIIEKSISITKNGHTHLKLSVKMPTKSTDTNQQEDIFYSISYYIEEGHLPIIDHMKTGVNLMINGKLEKKFIQTQDGKKLIHEIKANKIGVII